MSSKTGTVSSISFLIHSFFLLLDFFSFFRPIVVLIFIEDSVFERQIRLLLYKLDELTFPTRLLPKSLLFLLFLSTNVGI